ncbi:5-oxoprolinase subunit PxpB [Martelella endophytica]|nr:5-oxoprolinase subunit PxpB [Martelella endophytica]
MVRISPAGDSAVTVEFADGIDDAINRDVIALDRSLAETPIPGVRETIPSYRSLLVFYDPARIRGASLTERLAARAQTLKPEETPARRFCVPVCYDGPDMDELAALKAMTPAALAAAHAEGHYRVHMIGFAPGFAYLGGLPEQLATPRLDVPRQLVEASSVGIGGAQACITSLPGPSGWRYIGRTPLTLFDAGRKEPAFFRAGDLISFFAVTADDHAALARRAAAGEMIAEAL